MGKFKDLTGSKYGRLTVKERHCFNDNWNKPLWICVCECGTERIITGASLRDGKTQSCGCYSREIAAITGKENIKNTFKNKFSIHGKSDTHEYRVWLSMRKRVKEPNKKTYENLQIYDKWQHSFESFLNDMGEAPSNKHQIDRINNNEGYFPDNCRWVTRSQNCRNKTNNVLLEWCGETRCLYEWAETICPKLGIKPDTLQYRIKKGWDVEKAFTTPKLKNQFRSC